MSRKVLLALFGFFALSDHLPGQVWNFIGDYTGAERQYSAHDDYDRIIQSGAWRYFKPFDLEGVVLHDYYFTGPGGSVQIPSHLGGYPVRQIGNLAFKWLYSNPVTSVVIPNTVTNIADGAFRDCTNLISVIVPGSVTRIGTNAFIGCTSLLSITIPASVRSIGMGAFVNTGLKSIYFQGDRPAVGSYVFALSAPTVYYPLGASGWSNSFGGAPAQPYVLTPTPSQTPTPTVSPTPVPSVAITSVRITPPKRTITAGKSARVMVMIANNSTQGDTLQLTFASSNGAALPVPASRSVTVAGKANARQKAKTTRVVVTLSPPATASGLSQLTATFAGITSQPSAVTVKAAR